MSENFTGVVDYASSMVFELVSNSSVSNTSYPKAEDISVRFLFANGSAAENPLSEYPLFGGSSSLLSWTAFTGEMGKFAIGDQEGWCKSCGNTTGVCASSTASTTGTTTPAVTKGKEGGVSKVVAGVIGAMVTLAVVLGLEAIVMLVAGLRLVNKKRLAGGAGSVGSGEGVGAGGVKA